MGQIAASSRVAGSVDDCRAVREALWPLDAPRKATAEEAELRRHLDECVSCRAFFARDHALGQRLRRLRLLMPVPAPVRARWLAALDSTAVRSSASRRVPVAGSWRAVAGVVLAAGLALFVVILARPGHREAAFAEDFMSREIEAGAISFPDPVSAREFFRTGLGIPITPVALDQARLNKAMICLIKGERAAMVEYQLDGATVAHYRLPRREGGRPRAPSTATESGVHVIRWADESFEHALVSGLPTDRLERLVAEEFLATGP